MNFSSTYLNSNEMFEAKLVKFRYGQKNPNTKCRCQDIKINLCSLLMCIVGFAVGNVHTITLLDIN